MILNIRDVAEAYEAALKKGAASRAQGNQTAQMTDERGGNMQNGSEVTVII